MPDAFQQAAVIGVTAWGTTLAVHLARRGLPTLLIARSEAEAATLQRERRSPRLTGVVFPEQLTAGTIEDLRTADLVCFAVPSHTLAANASNVASALRGDATVLSATKGIDRETGRRMSEILGAALPGHRLAVISGPNLSREVVEGLPGSTVIATRDASIAALRGAFHSRALRVYTSEDVAGVEFGGALKNVIAIAGGMVDGFQFGNNAKAALLTRGLAEITRLGVAGGAQAMTFQGLAGIGDLIATSYSPLSRNRRLGALIADGTTLDDALAQLGETAEGATTIPAALRLAARLGVEMPITEGLQRILYEGAAPLEEVRALMEREPRSEH